MLEQIDDILLGTRYTLKATGARRAIIGIEIRLTRIEGKWKVSQNRSRHDRLGVISGLRAQGDDAKLTMAELVEAAMDEGED
jgi:predicted FMN-binding regulatory protein PaiB